MEESEEVAAWKNGMKIKLQELQELGIVEIDTDSKTLIIHADCLVYGTAANEEDGNTRKALVFKIISSETPFSMVHAVEDMNELRKLKNAIELILAEKGGIEIT